MKRISTLRWISSGRIPCASRIRITSYGSGYLLEEVVQEWWKSFEEICHISLVDNYCAFPIPYFSGKCSLLCFFTAYLFKKIFDKISSNQLQAMCVTQKSPDRCRLRSSIFKIRILSRLLIGVSRAKPKERDQRPAYLLHYNISFSFRPVQGCSVFKLLPQFSVFWNALSMFSKNYR